MKTLGTTILVLAFAAALAGIWTPYHWEFAATAVLLFFTGATINDHAKKRAKKLRTPRETAGGTPRSRYTSNDYKDL